MTDSRPALESTIEQSVRIRREIVQLAVLALLAVGAFTGTRAVAQANRRTSLRDAAAWYERGRGLLAEGDVERAVDAFNRAAAGDRQEARYRLALARGLAAKGRRDAARRVLLSLREAAPDATEVNVELARLAAVDHDLPEAVRFYHNALYAPWGTDQAAARRLLRAELIRFLLDNRQRRAAQSELLALSADLPEEAAPHTETGELFARAGDDRHALDQFQRALRIAPDDASALAGAGQAAFALGDYVQARKYLAFAPGNAQGVAATREIVEEILLRDPLAGRMPNTQRERRLRANLAYLRGRLDACVAQRAGAEGAPELAGLRDAVNVFEADLARTRDRDAIESGVELSDTIASQVAQSCPPATAVDQALVLIGRRHGAAER